MVQRAVISKTQRCLEKCLANVTCPPQLTPSLSLLCSSLPQRVNPVINGRVIRKLEEKGSGGFIGNYEIWGEWKLEFKLVNGEGERSKGWCVFEDKGADRCGFKYEVGGGWGWKEGVEGVGWKVKGRVNLKEDKDSKKNRWEALLRPKFPTVFDIVGTDGVVLLVRDVDNGNCWGFRRVKEGEESRLSEWVDEFNKK